MADVGKEFQGRTKYYRGKIPSRRLDRVQKPERYKRYPRANIVDLPAPQRRGGSPIWDVVKRRRSVRKYRDKAIPLRDLSQLLWACQGITSSGKELRANPSAGALYPIEVYVAANNVEGIEPGIYHYAVKEHELEQVVKGDVRNELGEAGLGQRYIANASAAFILSAIFGRAVWKYDQRGYRYVYLDAGHVGHAIALTSTGLGLASCPVGAFYDDEMDAILELDGKEESAVYVCTIGYEK